MRPISVAQPIESFRTYGSVAVLGSLSATRTLLEGIAAPTNGILLAPLATTTLAAGIVCAGAELYRAVHHQPPAPRPLGAEPCALKRWSIDDIAPLLKNAAVMGAQMFIVTAVLHGLSIGFFLPASAMLGHWCLGAIDVSVMLGLASTLPKVLERYLTNSEADNALKCILGFCLFLTYCSVFPPQLTLT